MKIAVLSVVHQADDVRIREKLIPTLAMDHEVVYGSKPPRPTRIDDCEWRPLSGHRVIRNLRLLGLLLRGDFDAAVLVDPETFPAGLLAGRRMPVVFDIHENIPGQIRSKPIPLRKVMARVAHWVIRRAERVGHVTLAESNYESLFSLQHPVFENFPVWDAFPPQADSDGSVVYLGDVTEQRGVLDLVRAAAQADMPLTLIGRCSDDLADRIRGLADQLHVDVDLPGFLPWQQGLERVAKAAVAASPLHDTDNYRQSLPTKVLEYLGVGVPVVATDLPGTSAVLGGMPAVKLVSPGDVKAMGEGFAELSTDHAREDARAAAELVRSRYRWPSEAVRSFYGDVVGDPGDSPTR